MTTKHAITTALLVLALVATATTAAAQGRDDECWKKCRDRKGVFFGINAGGGEGSFGSKLAGLSITEDGTEGGFGALRCGYAFSNSFALGLEAVGFGSDDDDRHDWGVGAAFVTVTWWPDGSGFYLRMGVGGGGGDVVIRSIDKKVDIDEKGAGYFGMGYEWRLGRKFALGAAVDAFGFDLEGASGLKDDYVGIGAFSIQCNFYL